MRGQVIGLQAIIGVTFRFSSRADLAIEFVVDTGFAGALTLPPAAVAALHLPFFEEIDATLANNATVRTSVHVARIVWDGLEQEVEVLAMGLRPLLGTALLNGKRLCADFEDGGSVVIDDLPLGKPNTASHF